MTVTMRLIRQNPNSTYTIIADSNINSADFPVNLVLTDYPVGVNGTGTYTYYLQAIVGAFDQMQYTNVNLAGLKIKR